MQSRPVYARPVPNSERPGKHGPIYRSVLDVGPELMLPGGVMTAYENFNYAVSLNPDGKYLGYRPIVNGVAQPFVWISYSEAAKRRDNLSSGLVNLGMCPANSEGLHLLGFFSRNRPEWVIGEQAAFAQSVVTVPLYDTLGRESVEYVVKQTELTSVLCGAKELPVLVETARTCPTLKNFIVMDDDVDKAKFQAELPNTRVWTMKEVEELGAKNPARHNPPAARSLASFCYTSGTTGEPKGALITHANLISDTAAIRRMGTGMQTSDVHLSYLPLPHMFERVVQVALVNGGAAIGFFQGDTLKIVEDLLALRPTVFPSVPRLLTRMHDKLLRGVEEAGGLKRALFNRAYSSKLAGLANGQYTHGFWDALVFKGVRSKVGLDRVRLIITGSAPIAPHVLDFLRVVFGCPVQEGYGQTESTAGSTVTADDDTSTGHVGGPIPVNEITLFDVPDMGYLSTDVVHAADSSEPIPCKGRGEICFRGPNVFAGYYKMPEKTAEAIDSEGWLHSGDIGLWLENGAIKIIDRKKNIFKLAQGEYVAPEKLENICNRSELVMQSFVVGDSLKNFLVAIVVPDPEVLQAWAAKHNLANRDHATLCKSDALKQAILKDLGKKADESRLQGFERVKNIHVEAEPWSPENGILTPTFKLKRAPAQDKYKQVIAQLYAEVENAAPPTDSKL